jgi:hypothetical protein
MRSYYYKTFTAVASALMLTGALISLVHANGYFTVCYANNAFNGCSAGDIYGSGQGGCGGYRNQADCQALNGQTVRCDGQDADPSAMCETVWWQLSFPPPACQPGDEFDCGNYATIWCEWMSPQCLAYEVDPDPSKGTCRVTSCDNPP